MGNIMIYKNYKIVLCSTKNIIVMKEILKIKRGWAIASYVIGLLYFALYVWVEKNSEAVFASIMVVVLAHIAGIWAMVIVPKSSRRKIMFTTFGLWFAMFSMVLFFTPTVLGLVASFASYVVIGYLHTSLLDNKTILSHTPLMADCADNNQEWKLALWAIWTFVPLVAYWNI